MIDYKKAKDILEYARQDQIKKFGTDEWLLPFEHRCLTDALRNKKYFIDTNSDEMVLNKEESNT